MLFCMPSFFRLDLYSLDTKGLIRQSIKQGWKQNHDTYEIIWHVFHDIWWLKTKCSWTIRLWDMSWICHMWIFLYQLQGRVKYFQKFQTIFMVKGIGLFCYSIPNCKPNYMHVQHTILSALKRTFDLITCTQ